MNKAKSKKYCKQYYLTHKEQCNARSKLYYSEHKTEIKEQGIIYRLNNKEYIKKQNTNYRKTHKKQIKELRLKIKQKYGGLYNTWVCMKNRCFNPNKDNYKYYGGRGITICKEWKNSFQLFYDWAITYGHKKGLEIDRENNSGNYCPENCRFITHTENCQKKSVTKLTIERVKEIRKLLKKDTLQKEIAKKFKVSTSTVSKIALNYYWRI